MIGFWGTGILLIFYLLHIIEKLRVIPWMMIEMIFCTVLFIFYLSCGIDLAVKYSHFRIEGTNNDGPIAFAAASFFSFVAMIAYGVDAFFKFQGWRAGQLAQGEQVTEQVESGTAQY